jgi:hypothetical protein
MDKYVICLSNEGYAASLGFKGVSIELLAPCITNARAREIKCDADPFESLTPLNRP